ncbi:MAG: OstA-like protein [Marinifilaceae bacterium]
MTRIKTLFLLLVCILLTGNISNGQKKAIVKIIHSDSSKLDVKNSIYKLLGNAKLDYQGLLLTCDSLYQYSDSNYIEAFGNVHAIQNDSLHLYGDYLHYDGNTQKAKVRQNVTMKDNQITLTTHFLDYDAGTKVGNYFNNGSIRDEINTLNSRVGYYFADSKVAFFRDSVHVINPEYNMYSDTMKYHTLNKIVTILGPTTIVGDERTLYSEHGWYNSLTSHAELYKNNHITYSTYYGVADTIVVDSTTGIVNMYQNIFLQDTINNVIAEGQYGQLERDNNKAFITDSALLTFVGQQDSLFVHGDTLFMVQDTLGNNIMMAYHNTKFYNTELQGICDSLIYHTADSMVYLRNKPVVWASLNQMTGDLITMQLKNNEVDQFELIGSGMIVNEPLTGLYNQIKGRKITGYMKDNELYMVYVDGSGEVLYYPDEKGDLIGMSKTQCSNIRIHMDQRKVQRIIFIGKPEGSTTPLFMVNQEEAKLRDFKWLIDIQPKKKEDIYIK